MHIDNAGCKSEPCRPASMQMHSAIIRVIAVPNKKALIPQEFRQRQNASSFHGYNRTKSIGMGFFFLSFLLAIIFEENTSSVSLNMIRSIMFWKICYLQLKIIKDNCKKNVLKQVTSSTNKN